MRQDQPTNAGKITIANGSCCIDRMSEEGSWVTHNVMSAPGMPNGVHYMNEVNKADRNVDASYEGPVAFVGKSNVFAFNDGKLVKHARSVMDGVPEAGSVSRIEYEGGRSKVTNTGPASELDLDDDPYPGPKM